MPAGPYVSLPFAGWVNDTGVSPPAVAQSCAGVMVSAWSTLVVSGFAAVDAFDPEHAAPAATLATIPAITSTFRPMFMVSGLAATGDGEVNENGDTEGREIQCAKWRAPVT